MNNNADFKEQRRKRNNANRGRPNVGFLRPGARAAE